MEVWTSKLRRATDFDILRAIPLSTDYLILGAQCFGEKDADEEFSDADVLSAVEFDDTGDFLATGDKGGRIVIFERADSGKVRAQHSQGYRRVKETIPQTLH